VHITIQQEVNNIISEIIKSQKEYIKRDEVPPFVLILFDDYYDNEILKRYSVLTELYSLSRHYNISIINVVHSYSLLNSNLRRMAKWFIIFKMTNEDEKKKMAYELSNCTELTENEFLRIYKDITDTKYNFALIDTIGGNTYRNFEKYIPSKIN